MTRQEWLRAQWERGLCQKCTEPSHGYALCERHRKRAAELQRLRWHRLKLNDRKKSMWAERKKSGLCIDCGKPSKPFRVRCGLHLEISAAKGRRLAAAKKEQRNVQ